MSEMPQLGLSPKQIASIVECEDYRINIWAGAVRSGKTIASIIAFFMGVNRAPKSGIIIIVGRTLQTIERNIIEPMQDEAIFGRMSFLVKHTRGSSIATICGRTVHLIGANDASSESKIRGASCSLVMLDEATLIPEAFFTQLLSRLSIKGARLLATTNPGSPQHFLKTKFLDRENDPEINLKSWHFMMDDNPSLSEEYVRAQKAENTGIWYLRNIEGRWCSADGAIYDMWDESKHLVKWGDLQEMQTILGVGVDHGTTNPTVAIMLGIGSDGNLYALDEWRHQASTSESRWTNTQLSEGMREWLGQKHHPKQDGLGHGFVIVDPAAADFHVQLRQDGIRTNMAENDVTYGIRTTASLFAADRLFISDRCKGLIKELPAYVWSSKASEDGKDQPVKMNDHSCFVAGTLVTTGRGYIPIEDVLVGDMALTRDGWHEIAEAGLSDTDAETFELTLSTGETLTGTTNHPIWVEGQGFIALGHLPRGALLHAETGEVTVAGVEPTGRREPVYNITVDGRPEYFANGILVHNCDALRYAIATTERKWRKHIQMNQPVQAAA